MLHKKRNYRRIASAILLIYGILALMYSVNVPAWEAPDEVGHYAFMKHLRQTGRLPVQTEGQLGEAHQPPLYYVLTAVASLPADISGAIGSFRGNPQFIWAGQGGYEVNVAIHGSAETFPFRQQALALHLARAASVLMGLGTVALTIKIGWDIFPNWPEIGLLAAALIAFNPQFLFLSGAMNNDNLLIMTVTGASWQTLRAIKNPAQWRSWLFVGLWLAVAMLTKLSGVAIVVAVGLFLFGFAFYKRSPWLFMRGTMTMGAIIFLVSGWWFVRNQVLYGDPLGIKVYEQIYAVNTRQSPLQWQDLRGFFSTQFRSYWGVFGWMNLPAPAWFFTAVRGLLLVAFVGLGIFAVRGQLKSLAIRQKGLLAFLLLILVMQEIIIFNMTTRCNASCYQGRYLFPVIGPMSLIISLGLLSLVPQRLHMLLTNGLLLIFVGLAVYMPLQVIQPAYETGALSRWRLWFLPNKLETNFAPYFSLKGYEFRDNETDIELTFYWQADAKPDFDYSLFVHLLDESGQIVVQKDGAPGETINFLPTAWEEGDIVADTRTLAFPADVPSGAYTLHVGMYNWATGERLAAFVEHAPVGDFVILEEILRR